MSNDSWLYGSFAYYHWPDALPGATFDNVEPRASGWMLFILVTTPGFYIHGSRPR